MEFPRTTRQRAPTATSMSSDLSEEPLAEVDEPPEGVKGAFCWSPPHLCSGFMRPPPKVGRRESLLTRAIHSETEHTDHDEPKSPTRALSTQSTWSSISMPSTAELTSDDGHSVPSMAGSPPPPATQIHHDVPATDKPAEHHVKIVGQDHVPSVTDKRASVADPVEATLGRKRCIAFACNGKQEEKARPTSEPAVQPEPASPPKRKCVIKFMCPSRADAGGKPAEKTETKRPISPPPFKRTPSANSKHRGSDATVTHVSPKMARKDLAAVDDAEDTPQAETPNRARRYSNDSNEDSGAEATRFHEFCASDNEAEDWTQMTTCYKSRLTVDDTLKKELKIRKTCEAAEEEALEEEEEEEEEEMEEELAAVAGDEVEDEADDDDETDDGFHSDDEEGFADSDSENDSDSDYEWWKPGGLSTAATSVDGLDRLAIVNSAQALGTSAGSTNSSLASPQALKPGMRRVPSKQDRTAAMAINRAPSPDLPDSTDFVCGTLDEDRPLEQAFVNRRKQKLAAKRGFCPQDIDPTFPTSDPEMDEEGEDEDEYAAPVEDEEDEMMHGDLDEIDGDGTARRKSPIKMRPTARSPPPMNKIRTRSPAAMTRIRTKSPAPVTKIRTRSPAPPKQRARSPAPPRRSIARSPPPARKLFGHSPNRMKSPAPVKRMTSPPNSPVERSATLSVAPHALAARPQPAHTSSLPRGGPMQLSKLATIPSDDEVSDEDNKGTEIPKRGAVDIVKGLEKKREFRRRKLAQKLNAKAANKGEKAYKVKPGMGCEKMREVGLAIQEYHGKAEHILSL